MPDTNLCAAKFDLLPDVSTQLYTSSIELKMKNNNFDQISKLTNFLIKYENIFDMSNINLVFNSIDKTKQQSEIEELTYEGKTFIKHHVGRRLILLLFSFN